MCTKLSIKIDTLSPAGAKSLFIPCGKCFDCRQSAKSQWIFRLRVELDALVKKNWKICFFTLTYNDAHLPFIPAELFKGEPQTVPCFKKEDVRTFIKKLRKWLDRTYKAKRTKSKDDMPRFMICSEYGGLRNRPHYHGILCVPPQVDLRLLHRKCKELWYSPSNPDEKGMQDGLGYFAPFGFEGDVDERGIRGKGFVCGSVKAAAMYASKYVCKDVGYMVELSKYDLFRRRKFFLNEITFEKVFLEDDFEDCASCSLFDNVAVAGQALDGAEVVYFKRVRTMTERPPYCELKLSDYLPFHIQTRSMGKSFLDGKSETDLLLFLRDGFCFSGEKTASALPVYLKNKIIFDPDYTFDEKSGKRLVRRKCKDFFRENLQEIYKIKVDALEIKLKDWLSFSCWRARDLEADDLRKLEGYIPSLVKPRDLAEFVVSYYGVPYNECYDINNALQWYRRFDYDYVFIDDKIPRINRDKYCYLSALYRGLAQINAKYEFIESEKKARDYERKEKILKYHKIKH